MFLLSRITEFLLIMSKVLLSRSSFNMNKVYCLYNRINGRMNKLIIYFTNNCDHLDKFKSGFEDEIEYLQSLLNRLDINSVICNTYFEVLRDFKVFPLKFEDHCIKLFGSFTPFKYDPRMRLNAYERYGAAKEVLERERYKVNFLQSLLDKYEEFGRLACKTEVLRRLKLEIEHRNAQGWYFVFNTLTVSPEYFSKVFPESGSSTVWTDYVRSLDRYFGEAAFGSFREAARRRRAGEDFHFYFAVVERGSKSGRLHIHVLHMFKSIPKDFSDPNFGLSVPYRREIEAMKCFWNFGFSSPIAVRFSAMDNFAKLGWRWPVKRVGSTYEAVMAKPFEAIVSYIGKYVQKSYLEKEVGCIWRTRMSRRMGQAPLKARVSLLKLKTRLEFLKLKKFPLELGMTRVPRKLMMRLVLKSLPLTILRNLFLRASRVVVVPLIRRLRSMIDGIPVFNPRNCGDSRISYSAMMDAFKYFKGSVRSFAIAGPAYV